MVGNGGADLGSEFVGGCLVEAILEQQIIPANDGIFDEAVAGPGDTLVVWRLSRLARSLKQIIETAHDLEQKKQALKVLTRNIDTGTPEGRLFSISRPPSMNFSVS
jgi:hypothetical protein